MDARLIALDAKTGQVAWQAQVGDPKQPFTITQAPRVVKDKVLIGESGAEYGVRGFLAAYAAPTGKTLWRFSSLPTATGAPDGEPSDKPLKEKAMPPWPDGQWKTVGGGGT